MMSSRKQYPFIPSLGLTSLPRANQCCGVVMMRVGVWWPESACVPITQSLLMLCDLESHASSECLVFTFIHANNVILCQYPVLSFFHGH